MSLLALRHHNQSQPHLSPRLTPHQSLPPPHLGPTPVCLSSKQIHGRHHSHSSPLSAEPPGTPEELCKNAFPRLQLSLQYNHPRHPGHQTVGSRPPQTHLLFATSYNLPTPSELSPSFNLLFLHQYSCHLKISWILSGLTCLVLPHPCCLTCSLSSVCSNIDQVAVIDSRGCNYKVVVENQEVVVLLNKFTTSQC